MARRVNPTMLLSLVIVIILSLGISAGAQLARDPADGLVGGTTAQQPTAAGTAEAALAAGKAQLGAPFKFSTDGPNTFSCSGLMRYILRTTGVDADAPWVPEEYLSKYARVNPTNLQPGDIVIYPGWATMYAGDGKLLNANEVTKAVTLTPMSVAGEPLGMVRPPYAGSSGAPAHPLPTEQQPLPAEQPLPTEQQPLPAEQPLPTEQQPLQQDDMLALVDPMQQTDQPQEADPVAHVDSDADVLIQH